MTSSTSSFVTSTAKKESSIVRKLVGDELIFIGRRTFPIIDCFFPRRLGTIFVLVSQLRTGTGFVENIDRLVRQKPVGNVAVRLRTLLPRGRLSNIGSDGTPRNARRCPS